MEPQTFEIQIPFAGFYCSIHSEEISQPLERLPDNWCEYMPCDIPQKLMDMFERSADYQNAFEEYARYYAQGFINEYLECRGVYVGMESPRFYNFETDRLFAKIPRHELARLWRPIADYGIRTDAEAAFEVIDQSHCIDGEVATNDRWIL